MTGMQRREFLGLGALAAAGALVGTRVAFAGASARQPRFVLIILRGALDGLSAVPPYADPDYAGLRGQVALRAPGEPGAALPLKGLRLASCARVPAALLYGAGTDRASRRRLPLSRAFALRWPGRARERSAAAHGCPAAG